MELFISTYEMLLMTQHVGSAILSNGRSQAGGMENVANVSTDDK